MGVQRALGAPCRAARVDDERARLGGQPRYPGLDLVLQRC